MKVFHCDHCGHLVFFENTQCVSCQHRLGFLPETMAVESLDLADDGSWSSPATKGTQRYRLCQNYREAAVCNWIVDADDPNPLCRSCRLTRFIPDLTVPGNSEAWFRLEAAKRRVIYTLMNLGLMERGTAQETAQIQGAVAPPEAGVTMDGSSGPASTAIDQAGPVDLAAGAAAPARSASGSEVADPGGVALAEQDPPSAATAGVVAGAFGAGDELAFQFLADPPDGSAPVLTGHMGGVVTINIAEADDAERERRRTLLGEPYRTLLGHMRHEVGHYYWDRLIGLNPERRDAFVQLFGDPADDYAAALQRHYTDGPPADWQARYVSAYASAHPWEDWAETWAHYLHMTDALETAASCGLSLRPGHEGDPSVARMPAEAGTPAGPFDDLLESWFPLTYVLNNLNRGLGLPDGYPFVLSATAVEKLRFVHDTIAAADRRE